MTELSSGAAMNQNDVHKFQSIGIPIPLVNMKIVDTHTGQELMYLEEGELLVASPDLMMGYINDAQATADAIELDENGVRWLHTGDLAKIDRDGFVFVTGRIKRIFITKDKNSVAYKLFPQRMEETIEQLEFVERCAVIVIDDEQQIHVPIVYVVLPEKEAGMEKVRKHIEQNRPEYYAPREIIVIDKLPVNTSQKSIIKG